MRSRILAVLAALILQAATLVAGPSPAHAATAGVRGDAPEVSAHGDRAAGVPVHGDYAGPIRFTDANADIDVATTVDRLAGAHVNTYAYLICFGLRGGRDWNTLPSFLAAAAARDIDVVVYLCPPSESQDSAGNEMPPYRLDYLGWARAIAQLSLTYPNLTGYAMDDFYGNLSKFTRSYVEQMVTAGRAVNPAIRFLPVLYYQNVVGYTNLLGPYRYYIDGVIFPYRNYSGGGDTVGTANADPEIRAVRASLACASGNHCAEFYFPGNTASRAGWSVQYSQTVTVDPAAPSYGLTMNVWDDFVGATSGYRYARVLIDNTVVWSRDIAGAQTGTAVTVPAATLRTALAGRTSATLKLQMYDARAVSNFHSVVTFDNLVATGFTVRNPDFEGSSEPNWAAARSTSAYLYGTPKNMAPIVMVYAYKHSAEPAGPTPTYVATVVQKALDLTAQGVAEGAMTYVLNKTGKDIRDGAGVVYSYAASYDAVAGIYAAA